MKLTNSSTRSAVRRERERAAARDSILAAAREIGLEGGWDAVTMRALAERLEYSSNFAYRYFLGRDQILLALVRDGFARLHTAMDAAVAGHQRQQQSSVDTPQGAPGDDTEPVWDAIRRAGRAYLDFALAEPAIYQLMYGLGGTRIPATDAWHEGQAVGDVLLKLMRKIDHATAERDVLRLWATAHGLVALSVVGRIVTDGNSLHAAFDDAITDVRLRAQSGLRSTHQGEPS